MTQAQRTKIERLSCEKDGITINWRDCTVSHFHFIRNYSNTKKINGQYWLVKDAGHMDAILMYPEKYGINMKTFFETYLYTVHMKK